MKRATDGTITLTIGFSPCPNDTYIFDALVNGRIPTGKYRFEPVLDDVESLNRRALNGELDITKLSFRAYADCFENYVFCDSGSALGFGVGPLLVAHPDAAGQPVSRLRIAIPGKRTTANFLFRIYYPEALECRELIFSGIEDAIIHKTVDAGVIIHENRFTYQSKGLVKITDLGEKWEQETSRPIPLGGIAIKRSIDPAIQKDINQLIRQSLEAANRDPSSTDEYVARHAQEMDPDVRKKHIALYVNDYTLDLGENGRSAVRYFFEKAFQAGVISKPVAEPLFVSGK